MKNIITLVLLVITMSCSAQLAKFKTIGYDDAIWRCACATVEDGQPVGHYMPIYGEEYSITDKKVNWEFHVSGVYRVDMVSPSRGITTHLYISIPSSGIETDSVYRVKSEDIHVIEKL